jgi:hypothetical protein
VPAPSITTTPNFDQIPGVLRQLTAEYAARLSQIDNETFTAKLHPERWSKKEILGHLIDSAQNNIRRFINAQYELDPPHIVYDQNYWVAANRYNQADAQDLILLWKLLNDRVAAILESLPIAKSENMCNTGKGKNEFHTLSFLAADYLAHAEHHLRKLIL